MGKRLNFKVDDETFRNFEKIRERDCLNISDVMRKLLNKFIKERLTQ